MVELPAETLPQLYASLMREIKLRIEALDDVFAQANDNIAHPRAILDCEFCYLQLRRCAECVALATLLAHNGLEQFRSRRLTTEWRGASLFNALAKLSVDAFPEPTTVSDMDSRGIADLHIASDAAKNRKELIEIHGRCADKLHAGSLAALIASGGKHYDLGQINRWRNFFTHLLNTHAILMPDRKAVMVVFMRHAAEREDVRCQFLPIQAVEGKGTKRSLKPRRLM